MGSQKITVIVPAYNTAPWLVRCLDSLLNQTYPDLEVIVVNDGSTDDTGRILDAYAAEHPRVRAIHKENGGVTSARLRGLREATGDWIGFSDADDAAEPEMYQRLMKNALEHGADIAHCGHRVCFPDGRIVKVHGTGCLRVQDNLTGLRDLMDGGQVESSLCTKLFRRKLFEGLEEWMLPQIRNNEDYLMNYYLFARSATSVYEDVCPYHYLLRPGSASYRVLNRNSVFDPIQVRRYILRGCGPELEADARKALLRNCLFAYAQLSVYRGPGACEYRREVRQLLAGERQWFPLLSRRNRLLANMICHTPWLFTLAYGLYVKVFQREEQH